MEAASRLVNTLLPLMYALTLTAYAADFFREDAFARRAARRLMELTLLLHAAHLALRTALYDHVPLASPAEMATTVAFAVSLVYVVVERRTGDRFQISALRNEPSTDPGNCLPARVGQADRGQERGRRCGRAEQWNRPAVREAPGQQSA